MGFGKGSYEVYPVLPPVAQFQQGGSLCGGGFQQRRGTLTGKERARYGFIGPQVYLPVDLPYPLAGRGPGDISRNLSEPGQLGNPYGIPSGCGTVGRPAEEELKVLQFLNSRGKPYQNSPPPLG